MKKQATTVEQINFNKLRRDQSEGPKVDKMIEALRDGMEAFRRLEAAGFLVLFDNGEFQLTDKGKAQVSSLIGHPCVIPLKRVPDLVSALEAWLLRHNADDSDDRRLVVAAGTIMERNGLIRMKFGNWR